METLSDEIFEIGKKIKGTKFSDQLTNQYFLKWVADELSRNYATSHSQLKRFFNYARQHGAYKVNVYTSERQ